MIPRLTKPEKGNKFYITRSRGGYSSAIEGSPTDKDCNVLSNCVGYAYGRFHEIGNNTKMNLLKPVNAEKFIQYADKSLKVGQTPKLGAVMVWSQGGKTSLDGAGHVAIVEELISDTEILTSESEYGGKAFTVKSRKKGSGNWGMRSAFKFEGFIYNPYVDEDDNMTQEQFNQMMDRWLEAKKAEKPSDYAKEALKWAKENKIMTGDEKGNQMPKAFVTREDFAVMLHRLEK